MARLFLHLYHHHYSIEVVHFAVHHHKSMTQLWSIISIIHYPLYPVHYDLLLMALVGPIPQLFPFLSPHKHSNDLWTNVDTLPYPLLFCPILPPINKSAWSWRVELAWFEGKSVQAPRYQTAICIRDGFKKSKWKFKMAFAMKGGGVSRGSRVPHTYFEKWFLLKNI